MTLEEQVAELTKRIEVLEMDMLWTRVKMNPDAYEGENVEYQSSDGTIYHLDQRHMRWLKLALVG